MEKLRVLDLFSGIGGFSLGLERTGGFETVAFCEIEKFPQRVLAKHWPEVKIYEDVRGLTAANGPSEVDLICGGYPCQPFSTAGKRDGKKDDRHLWPEVNRLLAEYRPSWGLFENVAGHISMGLDDVLSDLEKQGYTARTFIIPASALNAPHRRDRVWIMANSNRERLQGGATSRNVGCKRAGGDKLTERCGYNTRQTWLSEPNVGRVANGVPNGVDRLKSLGNAVVPQIPEILGHAILEAEREFSKQGRAA